MAGNVSFVQINLDYTRAIQQANRLVEAAERCSDMSRRVRNQMNALSDGWQGGAADAVMEKLQEWFLESEAIASQLQSTASAIRQKAEAIKYVDSSVALEIRNS